jgi:hypothetical protein
MQPMSAPLRPGDMVAGRYRIETQIGQGGFGAVFRATQVNIAREVALKMLLPELLAADEGLQRFRREAQLAQRLEHPNTVRLLDFGQAENGAPFIAFELLRGESMDRALHQQGRFSPGRVARITMQVLKSLMEAHALGIVHRDIKPPNIMLCEFQGESDYVKVLDFGIAKTTTPTATSAGLTQAGHVVGTPQYMAPEHLLGQAPSPAADLYALGLVMAEALAGQMIYQGVPTDVCLMQISPDPVPLPAMVLQSPLGPVIHRATQKAVERRYATAGEMLQHIETIVRQNGGDLDRGATARAPVMSAMATADTGYVAQALPPIGAPTATSAPTTPLHRAPPVGIPAPAPSHASSGPNMGMIVAIVAIVAVLAGAAGFFVSRGARNQGGGGGKEHVAAAEDPDDAPKKKGKKAKATTSDDDDDGDSADTLDLKAVKRRLEKAGYTVMSESSSKSQGLDMRALTLQQGKDYGGLYVYNYDDPNLAKQSESAFKSNKQAAIARIGKAVIMALMANDHTKSQDLLDEALP